MALNRFTAAVAGLMLSLAAPAAADDITVFAAASTTDAVTAVAKLFEQSGQGTITPAFAAASTLAKQIEQGAPAHVFLSANEKWMDFLADQNLLAVGTRANLLGNALVLIAPADAKPAAVTIDKTLPLADMLGDNRLAIGDPDHVPAGQYGQKALASLGLWDAVAPKLARLNTVRAVLTLVERGEVPFGIVYATDAAISDKITVVGRFPTESHPPIRYPVAAIAGKDTPTARAFLAFLKTPEARAVFQRFGFTLQD